MPPTTGLPGHRRFGLLCIVAAFAMSACNRAPTTTSTAGEFSVLVVDIDGPNVTVVVNGKSVGEISCASGALTLMADGVAVPSLPWTITLSRSNGSQFGTAVQLSGTEGAQAIIVRSGSVLSGPKGGSYGPAPTSPCPS